MKNSFHINTYSHIASTTEIGNVFANRRSIYETIRLNSNRSITQIENNILNFAKKHEYYKNVDESSPEYNIVKIKNKTTGKITKFEDKDTAIYYEMYSAIVADNGNEDSNKKNTSTETILQNNSEKESKIIEENSKRKEYSTPLELSEDVKKTIKGQDEAIETIITLLWMKYHYTDIPKSNILLIGPSGVGKTAIMNKIKSLLDIPLSTYAIPGTSQVGYKGGDLQDMLVNLYYESDEDIAKMQNGIIFIDEFDKLATSQDTGKVGTIALQNELLKLIEGNIVTIEIDSHRSFSVDTSNIIFVCCGAFSDLLTETKEKVVGFNNYPQNNNETKIITTEDIVNYGIISELIGRLPMIVQLNNLKREDLKNILLSSDESLFTILVNTINKEGIKIENLDETIDFIIDNALNKKIGARGLISPIRNMFLRIFYEINNNKGKYEKVILGNNIVNDNRDFILIPKKVKKKVKQMI